MTETKPCRKCGEDKPLSAYWLQPNGKRAPACYRCRNKSAREAPRRQARLEHEEALRGDLWAAMYRGRSKRAVVAVKDRPDATHRIKLRHEHGFVSIAELACRCVERDACHRASQACTTAEGATDRSSLLERDDQAPGRSFRLNRLWRVEQPVTSANELRGLMKPEPEDDPDPFEEAFGDWAPAWVSSPAGLSSHPA